MKKLILLVALAASGCGQTERPASEARIDFTYAKPNRVGMYDPRATPAGTFYLWNTENNRLTPLGEVELSPGSPSQPRTVVSDRLAGFGVEGLPLGDVKLVEAKLGGQFKTDVSDSVRQQFFDSKTALRDYVLKRKENGASTEDILDLFRPNQNNYRTVIFVTEERSGSASFRVGSANEQVDALTFSLQLPGQEILKVTADAQSSANCGRPSVSTGSRPVCFT